MLEIIKAKYEEDYKIRIEFNDGKSGIVDLKDDLWGSVFEPLKDKHKFEQFTVSDILHTISWENGADFAPEYLYNKCLTEPVI